MQRDSELQSVTVAPVGGHEDSSTEMSLLYACLFYLAHFFYYLASPYTNSTVTDGLRDFEINGVAIPSLFPYILPIALSDSGYCLSTGAQRGSSSLKEYGK